MKLSLGEYKCKEEQKGMLSINTCLKMITRSFYDCFSLLLFLKKTTLNLKMFLVPFISPDLTCLALPCVDLFSLSHLWFNHIFCKTCQAIKN